LKTGYKPFFMFAKPNREVIVFLLGSYGGCFGEEGWFKAKKTRISFP